MSTYRILVIGQSNAVGFGGPSSDYAVAISGNCQLWNWSGQLISPISDPANIDIPFEPIPSGSLCVTLANVVQSGTSDTVIIIPAASGASNLSTGPQHWKLTGASTLYQQSINRVTAASGCNAIVWYQGENDANANVDPYLYLTDLNTLANRYRTALSNPTLPFIAVPIGYGTQTDGYGSVRKAISKFDDGTRNFCTPPAAALLDVMHLNANNLKTIGNWCGNVVRYIRGQTSYYRGPKFSDLSLSSDRKQTTISCTLTSGNALLQTDNNNDSSNFRLYDNNVQKTISSMSIQNNQIILNTDVALSGTIKVDYLYSNAILGTNIIYGNDERSLPLDAFSEEYTVATYIGPWESTNCLFAVAPDAWSKGNGTSPKISGNLPSYPSGIAVNMTSFVSGYGYVPSTNSGYLRCRDTDNNYCTVSGFPYTFTTSSDETIELKLNFASGVNSQIFFGGYINTNNYWYISSFASSKLRFIFAVAGNFYYSDTTAALSPGDHTLHFRKRNTTELSIVVDGVVISAYDTYIPYAAGSLAITTQHEIARLKTATPQAWSKSNISWLAFYNRYLTNTECLANHNLSRSMDLIGNNSGDNLILSYTSTSNTSLSRRVRRRRNSVIEPLYR